MNVKFNGREHLTCSRNISIIRDYLAMKFLNFSCFLLETFSKAVTYLSSTLLSQKYLRDNFTPLDSSNANLSQLESLILVGIFPSVTTVYCQN